jgi:integrase
MNIIATCSRQPWNKGKLVGQKTPLRLRDIWAIRVRLEITERTRDLALFNLAIDSKLRACDLTKLRVRDVAHGEYVSSRAMVMQQKTQRPVQFEITEQTRSALTAWIHQAQLRSEDCLFPKVSSNVAIGIVSVRSTGIANDHQASPIAGGNGRHQSSGIPPS